MESTITAEDNLALDDSQSETRGRLKHCMICKPINRLCTTLYGHQFVMLSDPMCMFAEPMEYDDSGDELLDDYDSQDASQALDNTQADNSPPVYGCKLYTKYTKHTVT